MDVDPKPPEEGFYLRSYFLVRVHITAVREGCGKSKWKFKMAFAMKGGGISRGSRLPLSYFEK